MEGKICQSCAMPLTSDDMFGTNADGSVNEDYCKWCYDKGPVITTLTSS
ncbi:zinc ribbon domain-containing protein [Candidatus Saccharibacteria bacterium]|nr:zinc ribbon domain-containing protein [Candidatus Saccharibacteria bacterium]